MYSHRFLLFLVRLKLQTGFIYILIKIFIIKNSHNSLGGEDE